MAYKRYRLKNSWKRQDGNAYTRSMMPVPSGHLAGCRSSDYMKNDNYLTRLAMMLGIPTERLEK